MFKKSVLICTVFIASFLAVLTAAMVCLAFSPRGSAFLVKELLSFGDLARSVEWQRARGALLSGMILDNVVLKDIEGLPLPNTLTVTQIRLDIDGITWDDMAVDIDNLQLVIKDHDPIHAQAAFSAGQLQADLYTPGLALSQVRDLVPLEPLSRAYGRFSDLDVHLSGPLDKMKVVAKAMIEELRYKDFSLQDAPCQADLLLMPGKIRGDVFLPSGTLRGKKTAIVSLQESHIFFDGLPRDFTLDVKATSRVEKIKMTIALKGSFRQPDLSVTSASGLPQERLLLMLATNKTWSGTAGVVGEEGFSSGLAKDLLDYFVSSGDGKGLAQQLGLSELSVQYKKNEKGVVVGKDLNDSLQATYGVSQTEQEDGRVETTQRVGGEVQLTDKLSVEASQGFTRTTLDSPEQGTTTQSDQEIKVKYETRF